MAKPCLTHWFANKILPVRRPVRTKIAHGRFLPKVEPLDQRVLPAVTATFTAAGGTLRVLGDDLDNTIVVSRDAGGTILVNSGAVAIQGGPATVVNTRQIVILGQGGNDNLSLNETNGTLPAASLFGGDGNDVMTGGSGDDFADGGTGNDIAFLGAGDDTFQWNPGDGSDVVEGQGGSDRLGFNGSDQAEKFDISDSGIGLPFHRVRLTRDLGNVTMDLHGIEAIDLNAFGGADTITVNDQTATDIFDVNLDLNGSQGIGDGQADAVIINGTAGDDLGQIASFGTFIGANVSFFPFVNIAGAEATNDTLTVNTLGGNDVVDTSGLPAGLIGLTVNLGDGQTSATTTTTLGPSTATAVFGQRVTLLAEVTSEFVPTGTVTFRDGTTVLDTAPVDDSGQAALTVSLGVGNHALTVSFAGTGGFADSSSAAAAVTVNRAATTVALQSSVNPAVTSQAVTFTASVAAVAPGAGTPTGTVTFKDGNVVLGTVAVGAGGTATLTTSFAVAGGHVITADYNGDPNFNGSSQVLTAQVTAGTPRVTGVIVNGGADQRSIVTQIRIAFDQHVLLPLDPADAFRLVRQSDGVAVTLRAAVDDTGSGTVVTLTFTGGTVQGTSLADGRYTLTVLAGQVGSPNGALDGDGDGQAGGDFVLAGSPAGVGLFRLFGDVNGDGAVNGIDLASFRAAFGTVGLPAAAPFDFNGDGAVNGLDLAQFRARFGTIV